MCGRLSLYVPPSVLAERFDVTVPDDYRPRYNVAPGDDLVVVTNESRSEVDLLPWGLVPHWADDPDDSPRPINARAETVAEKAPFRDAFERHRCLVLADGFYEWAPGDGGKQPHRVVLDAAEGVDRPFAMAGLWDRWEGDGRTVETTTIVTTEANDVVRPIHDRMPVILGPDEEDRWLADADADAHRALLDPYDGAAMRTYPVSTAVNDPANDGPEVVQQVDPHGRPDGQTGLGEFGS